MTITRVRTLNVPVSDQDKAKTFYVDTLGFDVLADNDMGPTRWLEVAPPGAETSLVLGSHATMPPGSQKGVVLTTSDVDGDCARLRAAGVELEGPDDMPWGRQATFHDPDGNGFVLVLSTG
ncbi:catechol 2,3-dioxygenase-like lactoylglutathione lyase family enzyme [Haloactinopolyspora alba]|uniref:Catechol 2,3-dioxygenase-like lactoylglutathione lyase family enzyme n=1 Tax=Haloactinopolyspora alba TaxID=648780 RepID=A0A2P8EBL1_9ACTN|nr:VOC family protein [Haloactinopolyspora alba]PSL06840.1 catechol 2,3-dioxygenase-like lactoylglutathione lyase family enzyme [Haloactinopolyspora alba]